MTASAGLKVLSARTRYPRFYLLSLHIVFRSPRGAGLLQALVLHDLELGLVQLDVRGNTRLQQSHETAQHRGGISVNPQQ